MNQVFDFDSYRSFITRRLEQFPNSGYGQMSRLCRHIGVHSSLLSQILKGHKTLTTDQAAQIADFFGMSALETDYFLLLVQYERSGNSASRKVFLRQLERVKDQARDLSRRLRIEASLTEEQRSVFYSEWAYSAIRQATAIAGLNSVNTIASFLGLPRPKVRTILDFLVNAGLCKKSKDQYKIGPASTHLESSSPWIRVHHSNWRQQALQSLDTARPSDLHYTSPLTLSAKDAELLREKLVEFINELNLIVDASPSEKIYCLNLDWFDASKMPF